MVICSILHQIMQFLSQISHKHTYIHIQVKSWQEFQHKTSKSKIPKFIFQGFLHEITHLKQNSRQKSKETYMDACRGSKMRKIARN